MIDQSTYDEMFKVAYKSDEASKIAQVVEKLEYVIEVIPIDAIPMEIKTENREMFFYDGKIKIIVPKNAEITTKENSAFWENYKLVEDGKYVVSREYENDENLIRSVLSSLKTFIDSFENSLVSEKQYKIYESCMLLAESMISARFSREVIAALEVQQNVFRHSNNFEVLLFDSQLTVYGAYKNSLSEALEKSQSILTEQGA